MNSGSTGKGPSVAELQRLIRNKHPVEMILLTGQKIRGSLKWFDEQAYCIVIDAGESITLLRSAVIGYRMVPAAPQAAAQQAAPQSQEQS